MMPMAEMKQIACITADRTLAEKLQETVLKRGGTWRRIRKEEEAGRGQPPSLLVIDITDPDAIDVIRIVRESDSWRNVQTIAFGHPTHVYLFDAAKNAGADELIPRARFIRTFSARMDSLFKPNQQRSEPTQSESASPSSTGKQATV